MDLPANMLGCFFMGFLSAASALGLKSNKTAAFLPASHPWQKNKELFVGLRTGYCGSLTTFASWELSLTQLLIGVKGGDGGQWQQWLWGWIIGFELAFASHLVGEHAALVIDKWLLRESAGEPPKVQMEMTEQERPTEASEEGEDLYGKNELKEVVDGDHEHQLEKHHRNRHGYNKTLQESAARLETADPQQPKEPVSGAQGLHDAIQLSDKSGIGRSDHSQDTRYANLRSTPQSDMYNTQHSGPGSFGNQSQDSISEQTHSNPGDKPLPQGRIKPSHSTFCKPGSNANALTFACAMLVCFLLTILWVVLAVVDNERKHSGRRQQWFALLFAPFGCILRWLLSMLNTRSNKTRLSWFPLGTFLANVIACVVDYIIGGLSNRYLLGYWPTVLLPAIRVGYAGSLSTVSTFIAEVSSCYVQPVMVFILASAHGTSVCCNAVRFW